MHLSGLDIDATLTAAAARGDVSIVSRPVLLATNNESAEILVGSQRPFVQVQRALPTDAAIRDQIVQYKDVGTRLVVKPTISADGYVTLDVTQEVNSATAETAFDAPVISTRTVSTRLLIKDGQTIALGGLTDSQHDANQGGVPVLSSIPIIGGLFGNASRRATETELFIFLTPRVIRSDEEARDVTEPLEKKAGKVDK
jgi:general secretion pathway protein D